MVFIFFVVPLIFVLVSAFFVVKLIKKGMNKKTAVFSQIASAAFVILICFFCALSECRSAAAVSETSSAISHSQSDAESAARANAYGVGLVASAIALGMAGIGGGLAVAAAAPAAIVAMSESPDTVGKSMIFAVFGEAIALYGLLISVFILNKLDLLIGII
ncbi:MAG: ATP synthase subunit C [Oscillospiraceae bacterium]|jgi:V/A-type H+-transporting ATPase subunit K|nr:ATP synthase subunit C [Oscillospiraceae bacterium]